LRSAAAQPRAGRRARRRGAARLAGADGRGEDGVRRALLLLLPLAVGAPAAAEPLSRAEAVARAPERNPDVLRSLADREKLRGRATEARADALPEVNVLGSFQRYQDPGFFNSPNLDEFPPEVLQAFRPLPQQLWGGSVTLKQTLWSFSLG